MLVKHLRMNMINGSLTIMIFIVFFKYGVLEKSCHTIFKKNIEFFQDAFTWSDYLFVQYYVQYLHTYKRKTCFVSFLFSIIDFISRNGQRIVFSKTIVFIIGYTVS